MAATDWKKCVICADSRDILKRIPDNSIDFIFTDPPYNIGKHSTGNIPLPGRAPMNNDVAVWDWEDFNPEEWAEEFIRILKPNGNLFIFTSYNQIGRWYNTLDHRFDTTNFMVWHKTNPAPKIYKAGFLNSCELIFTCWNKGHTWNFISQAEMHNFFESAICMSPERLKNPKHPAQKPVALLKKIIQIASNEGDIIFDPFMGVGSTGVAALQLNRKFIGIEREHNYFQAAKNRIEDTLKQPSLFDSDMVSEPLSNNYGLPTTPYTELENIFPTSAQNRPTTQIVIHNIHAETNEKQLTPIIKWPGGKERELKYILPFLPTSFNDFYEPFVGGGSVCMAVTARHHYINDLSKELYQLYTLIAKQDKQFLHYVAQIDSSWESASLFFQNHSELIALYQQYRNNLIDVETLEQSIEQFCHAHYYEIYNSIAQTYAENSDILLKELIKNLHRKYIRTKQLEQTRHPISQSDLMGNIETAIKGSLYMFYRHLYNEVSFIEQHPTAHTALFMFIRNYCYSGMFRYNDKGEFNVPYGGMAYNAKRLKKKLDYYKSESLAQWFKTTTICNLDFEKFLAECQPTRSDFVFLDPPYDSDFSTYAKNSFTLEDQKRLANYLLQKCKAKWMLVIKYTEKIYSLYNYPNIKIRSFDKKYNVSFMNRNDRNVTHLLITNY